MKLLTLLGCVAGLLFAQINGNYTIRFEPRVLLQAKADIPFEIHVTDDRGKPLIGAKVTLQVETAQATQVAVFKATGIDDGVYVARANFPSPGQWSVYVEAQRAGMLSARTIEFNVPDNVGP